MISATSVRMVGSGLYRYSLIKHIRTSGSYYYWLYARHPFKSCTPFVFIHSLCMNLEMNDCMGAVLWLDSEPYRVVMSVPFAYPSTHK